MANGMGEINCTPQSIHLLDKLESAGNRSWQLHCLEEATLSIQMIPEKLRQRKFT